MGADGIATERKPGVVALAAGVERMRKAGELALGIPFALVPTIPLNAFLLLDTSLG